MRPGQGFPTIFSRTRNERFFPRGTKKTRSTSHRHTMEAIGLLQSGSNDGPEPWTKYLDGEMAETKRDDPVSYRLAEIIRDTLLSTNETRAAEAAQRIDSYYRYEYLVTDPFMRFLQGRGTAPFLCHLYGLVLEVASVIPSGVPHQDVLIQLLGELHKLPPTSCMLWNVRYSPPQMPCMQSRLTRRNRHHLLRTRRSPSLQRCWKQSGKGTAVRSPCSLFLFLRH